MNEELRERILRALDDTYVFNVDPQLYTDIKKALTKATPLTKEQIEEHNLNFFTPAKYSFMEGVHFAEKYYGIR